MGKTLNGQMESQGKNNLNNKIIIKIKETGTFMRVKPPFVRGLGAGHL